MKTATQVITEAATKIPFYKTDGFKIKASIVAFNFLSTFGSITYQWYINSRKQKAKDKAAVRLESVKTKNRREEEAQRHQHDMELQEKKAQDARDLQRQKTEDKIKVANQKKGVTTFNEEIPTEPLPTENVGDLLRRGVSDEERTYLLSNTPVQNRDIIMLYGMAGTGKSTFVTDLIAKITNTDSKLKLSPVETGKIFKYRAIYYDKEMERDKWQEKNEGRTDLDNLDRVKCRDYDISHVLGDIKFKLKKSPDDNFLIVIDPITNFGIKQKEIVAFINELATIQEDELAKGRHITFIIISHTVKSPKGKGLEDCAGSAVWGDAVKTVMAFMPCGPNDQFRKVRFDKAKNGKEFGRSSEYVLRFEKKPYCHYVCDEALNEGWTSEGFNPTEASPNKEAKTNFKNPRWKGVLVNISSEIAEKMQVMYDEEHKSYTAIAKELVPDLNLQKSQVQRVTEYVRKIKGLPNPRQKKARA